MASEDKAAWKHKQLSRLIQLFDAYPKFFIVGVDYVGSQQLQCIRMSLRGNAELILGKTSAMHKAIREHLVNNPALAKVLPFVRGRIGFVFTDKDLAVVKQSILANKIATAAKVGDRAILDVAVQAGPTGMDPSQTHFCAALSIPTRIIYGSIHITEDIVLVKKGDKVGSRQAAMLSVLRMLPFSRGLVILKVYDSGTVLDPDSIPDLPPFVDAITEETLTKVEEEEEATVFIDLF